jgi:glutamate 5-kinase
VSRELIKKASNIVIKIGTKVLTEDDNTLDVFVIESIVRQISEFAQSEKNFIIVSSGAIALGLNRMGLKTRPVEINFLQAAASLGQSGLMHAYEAAFRGSKYEPAQILMAYEDIRNRKKYLNIRNTIFALWSFNAIPIVNENDSVTYSEIRFGDNDLLAAHLSIMMDADLLLILTDIDGVYDKNPNLDGSAKIIEEIPMASSQNIASLIENAAQGKGSSFSSGGMKSKLEAARIATKSGIGVVIANGKDIDLKGLFGGKRVGTLCLPAQKKIRGKKKWIAFNPKVEGKIIIDRGGERAIVREKKSLLPAGIKEVIGRFEIGGNVSIQNEDHVEVARGLTNFSSKELALIKGLNTSKIPEVLGVDTYFDEVVHRDNMVVLV